jgi:hypothetical protein
VKVFAEFYHDSTGWNGQDFSGPVKLIPACGSDSVLRLDGRYGLPRLHATARRYGQNLNASLGKGYRGYTLNAGESYSRAREIAPLRML